MKENAILEAQILEEIHKIRNKSRRPDEEVIFKCTVKNSAMNITFQDIAKQVKDMMKSGRAENRQTVQELFSFFVTDSNIFCDR